MIRIGVILILLPFMNLQTTQDEAGNILARTEKVYKNLNSSHFSGVISYDWTSNGKTHVFQEYFQCFKAKDGKARYQRGVGTSKILAMTDGKKSVLYLAEKRQYQSSNSSDLDAFLQKSLELKNAAWVFPSISLLEKYGNIKSRFHDPKLLSDQNLSLDGKVVSCFVLEGVMDPMETDAVWGSRKTRLWVDKNRFTILREECSGTSTDNPAKGDGLKETVTFNTANTDENPADNLFTFDIPSGTEEVNQLFGSIAPPKSPGKTPSIDRSRSFHYLLPFLAMKNFTLQSINGEELNLSRFRGKLVLLDFWATWCIPCQKQMKDLENILNKYSDKDLAVFGLNDESMGISREFFRKKAPAYPLLHDAGGKLASLYGASTLPTLVLLDRSGRIILKKEERQTYKQIELLLKEAGL
jgi:peroxiredoxin/outer membrane lipoprotein-sorting protein